MQTLAQIARIDMCKIWSCDDSLPREQAWVPIQARQFFLI